MLFNKTTVIIQRLIPPFLVKKKRVTFQKNTFFNFPFLRRRFFVSLCSHVFSGVLRKHMFHASVGPLGLSLRPSLATARAREIQSPACFPFFWLFSLFDLFDCFPSCPASPLFKSGIQKLPFARRWLPVGIVVSSLFEYILDFWIYLWSFLYVSLANFLNALF